MDSSKKYRLLKRIGMVSLLYISILFYIYFFTSWDFNLEQGDPLSWILIIPFLVFFPFLITGSLLQDAEKDPGVLSKHEKAFYIAVILFSLVGGIFLIFGVLRALNNVLVEMIAFFYIAFIAFYLALLLCYIKKKGILTNRLLSKSRDIRPRLL